MKFVKLFEDYLNEATVGELLDLGSKHTTTSNYNIEFLGFKRRQKRLLFKNGEYDNWIQLNDFTQISRLKGELKDKINISLDGDIGVYCSCNAFKYLGHKYNVLQLDSGIRKETRAPNIKDPNRDNFLCKHLKDLLGRIERGEIEINLE